MAEVPVASLEVNDAYVTPSDDKGIAHVVVAKDPTLLIMSVIKIEGDKKDPKKKPKKTPLVLSPPEAAATMCTKLPPGVGAFLLAM